MSANASNESGHEHAGWLSIPSAISSNSEYRCLAASSHAEVQRKITAGDYTADEVYYVSRVNLAVCKGDLSISAERLEKLRRMCQLWDIDLKPREITSHRRFVGPLIVFIKQRTFPILRFFLRDLIRQQKDFNAAAIALVGDLANESSSHGCESLDQ